MAIRRGFGIVDDAGGSGAGSSYDDLAAGVGGTELKAIPNATTWWPVTGGAIDRNIERITRENEVRGRRAAVSPLTFREAPVITVPVPAYRSVLEKLWKKALGGVDTVTGMASPYDHTIEALGYGSLHLPPFHVQMIRDDLNLKMSGGSVQRVTMSFPFDGEGTAEAEIWGLYDQLYAAVPPTPTLSDVDDVMMLRDARAYFDPTTIPAAPTDVVGTQIPDLQGFELTWTNNLARRHYAGRNISLLSIGAVPKTRKIWWPEENRIGAAQDITLALNFGSTNAAQELAAEYAQIQKLVFDVVGGPIAGGVEMMRITVHNSVWSGGGADALSARDDINSRLEGSAYYDDVATKDVVFEFVNAIATPIT